LTAEPCAPRHIAALEFAQHLSAPEDTCFAAAVSVAR